MRWPRSPARARRGVAVGSERGPVSLASRLQRDGGAVRGGGRFDPEVNPRPRDGVRRPRLLGNFWSPGLSPVSFWAEPHTQAGCPEDGARKSSHPA